jgi:protein-disulfide isomerase
MNMKWTGTLAGCALLAAASLACAQQPAAAAASPGQPVVAKIGDEVITAAELETMVGPSLVRQDIYDTTVAQLKEQIFDRLVAKKATEAGLTVDDYLKQEIDAKAGEIDEAEIVKVMSMYRSRLAQDDAQAREQVVQALSQQQKAVLRGQLMDRLFAEAGVEILLEPPRVEVAVSQGTPTRGNPAAPIVLVEFTDFQCPFCARVQPTLDALMVRYEGQIRHVFKNLPLPIHPQAQLAAEASLCAQDQDKYWEFHNWLFANQRSISRDSVLVEAGELGMDTELFATCINRGTHTKQVDADAKEARSFGINGTPGFLINGRVITGAVPIENFEAIIDEELTRRGIAVPPKEEPAAEAAEAAEAKPEEPASE